jgi:ribosomal protein S17
VAVKSLGAGPFSSTVGTVTKVEGHRSITIADKAGAAHTFKIDKDTVAEGGFGVVVGEKFDVNKGDQVRVVSAKVDGDPTALFMRDL